MALKNELRILTPIGMLGYSFDEHLYWTEIENGVDAIILDSGSTDSGPSRLALGLTSASREAYERDLKLLVTASANKHIPVLIGTYRLFHALGAARVVRGALECQTDRYLGGVHTDISSRRNDD